MRRPTSRVGRALLVVAIVTILIVSAAPTAADGASGATGRGGDGAAAVWTDRSVADGGDVRDTSDSAVARPEQPTINATHAFERAPDPGVVAVRVTYDVPRSVTGLVVDPAARNADRLTVTDTTGFVETSEGDRWRWERDDSAVEAPSLRLRYAVNESSTVFGGFDYVDTGEWALFGPPRPVLGRYRSSEGEVAFDRAVAVADGESGYATPGMVYLGQHERTNGTRHGQEFVVVTPAAAAPTNASAVLDTLGAANRLYDVPRRDERVVAFVGPSPLREGGLRASVGGVNGSGVDSIWVSAESPADGTTYVHEYVHTRQEFSTTDRMNWLVEAQASYYGQLLPLYRGTKSYREFHSEVSTAENATRRLAPETRTADTLPVDYSKGARVLAALDAKIRTATDRNRSLADVVRRLNRHDGRVSYADFKNAVAAVSGRRLGGWLDRHLTTTDAPTVPLDQSLYAPVQSGVDSDGDGLHTAAELDNGTEPFAADTDGDGFDDGEELRRGTDPLSYDDSPRRTESEEPAPEAGDSEGTASGDADGAASGDDGIGPGVAFAVLGSLVATGVFGVGAVGAGAAKLLSRRVGVEIGVLTRRSVVRLVLLSAASLAVFTAIVAFVEFVG
ncbi:hypothetical protein [Halobellus ruber]|uniref:Uncharacterized protein n=1 Tax=Halobellus ruber TaxID=2761102 RepID=A0A7J9SH14_9EURY|nr:hypothetical protein [Halobellus ruber]MBB6646254.1 hypothetical protein [Halobellus ruber]